MRRWVEVRMMNATECASDLIHFEPSLYIIIHPESWHRFIIACLIHGLLMNLIQCFTSCGVLQCCNTRNLAVIFSFLSFSRRRIMMLEFSQYLENYLWPNFTAEHSSKAYLVSIAVMVNEKFRERVPAWKVSFDSKLQRSTLSLVPFIWLINSEFSCISHCQNYAKKSHYFICCHLGIRHFSSQLAQQNLAFTLGEYSGLSLLSQERRMKEMLAFLWHYVRKLNCFPSSQIVLEVWRRRWF